MEAHRAVDQLRLINQTMVTLGHECHTFTEGKTLLQALRRQTFDLDGTCPT